MKRDNINSLAYSQPTVRQSRSTAHPRALQLAGDETLLAALAEPGHRYTAAWGISQRIAQRQTLVAYYTTIGGAILSFSYLAKAGESDRTVLAYAIGPLSLMFAVLLRMHEVQIAILRSYLARIEKLDDVALYGWWYPKFHSHGKCSSKAQDIRMYHDRVAFVLVGLYGIAAAYLTFSYHLKGDLKAMDIPDRIFSVIALPSWVWSLMWLHSNSGERMTVFDELMKSEGPDLKVLAATDSRGVPTEPAEPAEAPAESQRVD